MQTKPFSRSLNFFALIASVGAAAAYQQLGDYKSRGKGKGKYSGKAYGFRSTTFKVPLGGGQREVARRQRQIAAGTLNFQSL